MAAQTCGSRERPCGSIMQCRSLPKKSAGPLQAAKEASLVASKNLASGIGQVHARAMQNQRVKHCMPCLFLSLHQKAPASGVLARTLRTLAYPP